MNAFESVRQRGMNVQVVAETAAQLKAVPQNCSHALRKWKTGEPPHVGWWRARQGMGCAGWRWWNGHVWSLPATSAKTAVEAASLAQFQADNSASLSWSPDWPEAARVPRINPETGEVTGGEA